MHIPLALTHFRIKHKDYLIFTEPLALGTLLNSVYYKLYSGHEEHCGFQTKAHVGQS